MKIEHTIDHEGHAIKLSKIKLSLCMIVRDYGTEWMYIDNCLSNAYGKVFEIIIVTDKSFQSKEKCQELLSKYNVKFIFYNWQDDFSKARNESIKYARGDWIVVLDADEVIFSQDFDKMFSFLKHSETLGVYDAFEFPQVTYNNNSWDYKWQPVDNVFTQNSGFTGASFVPIVRLFKNNIGLKFINKVHEVIDEASIKNRVGRMGIPIHHMKYFKGEEAVNKTELKYLELMKDQAKENPTSKVYFDMGLTYKNILKDFQNALLCFHKALEIEERSEILISIGRVYSDLGNIKKAIEIYQRASKLDSENPAIFANIGFCYYRIGEFENALDNLKKSLALGINNKAMVEDLIKTIEKK